MGVMVTLSSQWARGPALWRESRTHAPMEQGGGYSPKFPPSQHPACTLLVSSLPRPRLLGITASPSFAAESNKSIIWLLERFPEFRDFLPKSCYLLESSPMVSFLLSFLAIEFSIKLIEFTCLSSMITNKTLILRAREILDRCACLRETLPSSDLTADHVKGLKHHAFCKVLYGNTATHFKLNFPVDGPMVSVVRAENATQL